MEGKIVLSILLIFMIVIFSVIWSIDRRINKIQKQLEQIAGKIGITEEQVNEEIDNELIGLISQGKIVKAIKKYKNLTGESFKEASKYIESFTNKEK